MVSEAYIGVAWFCLLTAEEALAADQGRRLVKLSLLLYVKCDFLSMHISNWNGKSQPNKLDGC